MAKAKKSTQKKQEGLSRTQLEKLLDKQTKTILGAVDVRLGKQSESIDSKFKEQNESINEKLAILRFEITTDVDKKLAVMETRINGKLDKLTTTLDKFLKRLLDQEDEFEIMKKDVKRLKKIIREKLGIEI